MAPWILVGLFVIGPWGEIVMFRGRARCVRAAGAAMAGTLLLAAAADAQVPLQRPGQQRPWADRNPDIGTGQATSLAHAQPAPAAFAEITDETGRRVRIPQPVRRIVSLAPSLTETLYALGAQDRLVGDTDYCDYPPEAQKKPKVGGAINPNLEQIAALRPDLVLMTKSLNRYETVRALDDLHIPSYATDPHTVDDIISSTARLAEVLGIGEAGQALAQELRQRLTEIEGRVGELPRRRVLFVVWSDPLISVGRNTFIADALRRARAISVIDTAQDWPQVSLEEVVHLQPEALIFAATHPQAEARDFAALAQRPGWRDLEAVRKSRFVVITDAVNRPAPRLISAIEELARQLHPEAFSERPRTSPAAPPGLESRTADRDSRASWGACACSR